MADAQSDVIGEASPGTPVSSDEGTQVTQPATSAKIIDQFKARIANAKRHRRQFQSEWKRNVDLRLGSIATQFTGGVSVADEIKSEVNPDWSLTKTKTANLYSQVPAVTVTYENKEYAAAIGPFSKALNYELSEKRANIGVAMEEVLNDVVNAAGVGAMIVGYAARFVNKQVPAIDPATLPPEMMTQLMQSGQMPMVEAPQVASDKLYVTRISPSDLLWPSEFVGSCFDDADWIGRTARCSWSEAKSDFGLADHLYDEITQGDGRRPELDLRSQPDRAGDGDTRSVVYDEIFYWRYKVDPEEPQFKAIWRMVFVHGVDQPVKNEPWKGQQLDHTSGKYVGACKFPIRVLTLTYVTDNPIPPSDSSAGRPQVNDLRRSRSQMFQNRERSTPVRWFDVNRVDVEIRDLLMKGTIQGWIPTNGNGQNTVGEIARASYPAEDFTFDQTTKADLMETWQIGPNQAGMMTSGEKTKAEVTTTQANFATRIGQERARVANHFLSAVEVMAGLMALYSDFPTLSQDERQAMSKVWDNKHILHDFVFKIRPDSTIMLDSQTRIDRLAKFLNLTVKSGMVNAEPIISEMAALSGLDPAEVVHPLPPPQPPPPPQPTISYSFKGKEDLINPVVMAMLIKQGEAPTPQELEAAKRLLGAMQLPAEGEAPPAGEPQGPQQPGQPQLPPAQPHGAHPDWKLGDRIMKRSRDAGGGS